jgi:hypothetical protein
MCAVERRTRKSGLRPHSKETLAQSSLPFQFAKGYGVRFVYLCVNVGLAIAAAWCV